MVVSCLECGTKNRLAPAGSVAGALPRCGRCQAPLPWLVDARTDSFEAETRAPVPVLVDFWAGWCGPCRQVAPVLQSLSRRLAGRLKVVKVDVDQNPQLAARYNARSIPMLLLLDGGDVVDTWVGALSEARLFAALEPHLPKEAVL